MLLVTWMFEAALPRTAEKAALRMRLPRTVTLCARNTLMALPFCPEPPFCAAVSSMRLSSTCVPSSPACERQTWMPLLPALRMVLRAIVSPRASTEKIAVARAPVIVVPVTSPSIASSTMPLRPGLTISQSRIATLRPAASWMRPASSGSFRPVPSNVMPERRIWSASRATISGTLSSATMRVAPGTPISRAPVGSTSARAR